MIEPKMHSSQAIAEINSVLKAKSNVNLAFCICDNQKLNRVIKAYRYGDISLDSAAEQALTTVKQSERGQL
ncbi:hypothetical protein L1076_23700 [Vibrio sp. MMG022]|uniref:hypothetical protein n=1 Tax=Vibrio sp. MMG023 TaxID=2909979 RepID=UPI001F3F5433|nr:hypothetical protein [Vibrio sp. MMG023]MCF6454592.1 hypothetical protein [Vibrio sp. MMG023]